MAFADFYGKRPRFENENPDEIMNNGGQKQRAAQDEIASQRGQAAQPEANAAKAEPQSEMAGIPAPVEQPKKSTVDMSWWQSPHYAQAEQALQQQARATMEQQERRALNERRAALLGDIARLGAQTWAKSGGAWVIPRTESQAAAANTRLQQLRDKHAADMLAYSQRLQQARLADKQDQMRKEQTRHAIAKEQAATAAAAQQQAFDNAVKLQEIQNEKEANAGKIALDMARLQTDAAYKNAMADAARKRADAYDRHVTNNGGQASKKVLPFTNPADSNEKYSIAENVYNANMGALYDLIVQDLEKDPRLVNMLGLDKVYMGGSSTDAMRNVVSALWSASPRARAYMKVLEDASRQEQGQQGDGKADIWDDTELIELDNI